MSFSMRVLVCGGRDYTDLEKMWSVIRNYFYGPEDTLICGMARGADLLAYRLVAGTDCHIEEYPANWEKYGRGAGHIRNQQMLDEGKPDIVIAFPGGRGTANMIERAKKAGVEVIIVE